MSALERRVTIGLAIGEEFVRAVGTRQGRPLWAAERSRASESLGTTLDRLLREMPRTRWLPRVVVAIGPATAQMKRISGLPPLADDNAASQLVRESSSRFFLRNGAPLVVTESRRVDDALWVAAFEQPMVDATISAFRTAGLRLVAFVPSVAVLGAGLEDDEVEWRDGPVATTVHIKHRALVDARRTHASADGGASTPRVTAALSALGSDAWRFADAYGAAVIPTSEVTFWRPGDFSADGSARPRSPFTLALTVLVSAIAIAIISPPLIAEREADRAGARLKAMSAPWREAAATSRELARVTAALTEVARFDARRYSVTALLADVTHALPKDASLVALKVDTAAGSVVALAPRAAAVLTGLERIPGIEAPSIIGPVTREVIGSRTLERLTVRFRIDPGRRRGVPPRGQQ